jgi:protein phosphatase
VWALQHWFVGVSEDQGQEQVAVFRGLDVSLLGLDLFRLDRDADLPVTDLTPAARNRVVSGITADDADDAARIVSALRDQRLRPCPTGEDDEPAVPTGSPPDEGSPDGAVPGALPSAFPAPGVEPGTPDSSAATSTSAATTSSSRPGVDCREAG